MQSFVIVSANCYPVSGLVSWILYSTSGQWWIMIAHWYEVTDKDVVIQAISCSAWKENVLFDVLAFHRLKVLPTRNIACQQLQHIAAGQARIVFISTQSHKKRILYEHLPTLLLAAIYEYIGPNHGQFYWCKVHTGVDTRQMNSFQPCARQALSCWFLDTKTGTVLAAHIVTICNRLNDKI